MEESFFDKICTVEFWLSALVVINITMFVGTLVLSGVVEYVVKQRRKELGISADDVTLESGKTEAERVHDLAWAKKSYSGIIFYGDNWNNPEFHQALKQYGLKIVAEDVADRDIEVGEQLTESEFVNKVEEVISAYREAEKKKIW